MTGKTRAVLMPFAYLLPPKGLGIGKCPASFLCRFYERAIFKKFK